MVGFVEGLLEHPRVRTSDLPRVLQWFPAPAAAAAEAVAATADRLNFGPLLVWLSSVGCSSGHDLRGSNLLLPLLHHMLDC